MSPMSDILMEEILHQTCYLFKKTPMKRNGRFEILRINPLFRQASETLPRLRKSSKSSSPTPRNSPRQLWGAAMASPVSGRSLVSLRPQPHHGNMHHFLEDSLRNSFYHLHHVYLYRSIKVILHRPWYLSRYPSISGIIISFKSVCDKCVESHPILEEKLPTRGVVFFPAMFKRVKKTNVPSMIASLKKSFNYQVGSCQW